MTSSPNRLLLALCLAGLAAGVAACGPDPQEVDRSPVAGMTDQDARPGTFEGAVADRGPRNNGELTLEGAPRAAGQAAVDCGPFPPADAEAHGFRVAWAPHEPEGLRVEVTVEDFHGAGSYEGRLALVAADPDGAVHASAGSARITLEDGTFLANDAATHYVSGSFTGTYRGDAGEGKAAGRVERCFYFG